MCFNRGVRSLEDNEISALLSGALVAHVAVVDGDFPYVGPLSFVYTDGVLAFRTMDGRRLAAIRDNPNVSVEVSETGPGVADWASVIIAGTAEVIDGTAQAGHIVGRLIAKYRAAYGASPPPAWLTEDGSHLVAITPTACLLSAVLDGHPVRAATAVEPWHHTLAAALADGSVSRPGTRGFDEAA